VGDSQGEGLRCRLLHAQLTTELLDCDRPELDELRGAEDCEVMADSTLLPEPVEKCWADGLRCERDETLEVDCMCVWVCVRVGSQSEGFLFMSKTDGRKTGRDTADARSKE
jgi:hypothetical protein